MINKTFKTNSKLFQTDKKTDKTEKILETHLATLKRI